MAERGAHLTTTLQPKPSIFEVVASDSLNQTFQPALLRLCNVSLSRCLSKIKAFIINNYINLMTEVLSIGKSRKVWMVSSIL